MDAGPFEADRQWRLQRARTAAKWAFPIALIASLGLTLLGAHWLIALILCLSLALAASGFHGYIGP